MSDEEKLPRFMRFVHEFEIEVTDPVAAAAFVMDFTRDEAGDPAMVVWPGADQSISNAVGRVVTDSLANAHAVAGFRWLSGGPLRRLPNQDGYYDEFTLPETPGRRDDESIVYPPSWGR